MTSRWLQIRGDPSIRRFLFSQSRVNNELDENLDEVVNTVEQLLQRHGVFHAKIHFSSGQVTLWHLEDPFNYQVCLKEEFLASGFVGRFRIKRYPLNAIVPPAQIRRVLEVFCGLRHKDEAIYLRSGSLNVINGMVGLNFSCDGSHYIDFREFLDNQDYR